MLYWLLQACRTLSQPKQRRPKYLSLLRYLLAFLLGLCLALGLSGLPLTAQPTAQSLNLQAQQQLEQGNPEAALITWQRAETLYRQLAQPAGIAGTRINQAKALQVLGFYRRARQILEQTLDQPITDPSLKVQILDTYGNLLRRMGELDAAQTVLQEGLAISTARSFEGITQARTSATDLQSIYLHLGMLQLAQQNPHRALESFQLAANSPEPAQVAARLHQLRLLWQLDQPQQAASLLPQLEAQIAALPPSQISLNAHLELATLLPLVELGQRSSTAAKSTPPIRAAQLLATAVRQSRTLGDRRGESYAVGRLGHLYEQTEQWAVAKQLTQEALQLAQVIRVPEILYQWQWQMGRIARAQGDLPAAISFYTAAVDNLQSLRNDLVAIGQDAQFSFRDQVEPVYRQLVDLLLQPTPRDVSQRNLRKARQVIESLQLAELNNFLREACLEGTPRQIDEIDPTAAVLYPVILPDRLDVILSLPGQPLRHYTTQQPQAELEASIQQMVQSMRVTSFTQERLAAAQPLYQWLIQPAIADLSRHQIKTLVFVLDGALRSLPIAALHDGKQYLVEQYRLALAPGLQLLSPRSLQRSQLQALIGGLSEGTSAASPLPGVYQEVEQIRQQLRSSVLLNQTFTTSGLKSQVDAAPYNIVHLATHGKFSSQSQETYIQTWDSRLDVNALQALLNQRQQTRSGAIELLVLSACQTAEGDKRAALGMAGIAVRSGARSTLATLWTVNDESTAKLMTEFYQVLIQADTTKAQSLRQAQLQLLQSPQFKHPYYWAPFVLVGNWL